MADPWAVVSSEGSDADPWAVAKPAPSSAPRRNETFIGPRKRTLRERFTDNADASYNRGTLLGSAANALATSLDDHSAISQAYGRSNYERNKQRGDAELYQMVSQSDPWYRAGDSVFAKGAAGAATLLGQVAGSVPTPESLVGVGKAGLLKLMGVNAVVNAAADVPTQHLNIAAGSQDKYDPWQTVASAGIGALLPVAPRAVSEGVRVAKPAAKAAGRAVRDGWEVVSGAARQSRAGAPGDVPAGSVLDPFDAPFQVRETSAPKVVEPEAPKAPDLTDRALDRLRDRQPVKVDQGPSLVDWLRDGDDVAPPGVVDPGGELARLGADALHKGRPFVPRLIREGGKDLEAAAVRAQELGYLSERFDSDGVVDTRATTQDLLDAVRREIAGQAVYSRQRTDAPEVLDAIELRDHMRDLDEVVAAAGLDLDNMSNADLRRAIDDYFRTQDAPPSSRAGDELLTDDVDAIFGARNPSQSPESEPVRLADGPADQTLIPGVAPVSAAQKAISAELRARLARRGVAPPPKGGLFDQVPAEPAAKTGDLFAARDTVGPAELSRSVAPIRVGDLWRLPRKDLERMLAEKTEADRKALVKAFGSEAAAEDFMRLDRLTNSESPRVADMATAELNEKFGKLTPEQERLVYGIGEEDVPQVDDLRDILREADDFSSHTDADLIDEIGSAIRSARDPKALRRVMAGEGKSWDQASFVRLGGALSELRARGKADNLTPKVISALVERGYGKRADVEEVVGGFLAALERPDSSASGGALLGGGGGAPGRVLGAPRDTAPPAHGAVREMEASSSSRTGRPVETNGGDSVLGARSRDLRAQQRPGAVPSGDKVGTAAYTGRRVADMLDGLVKSMGLTVRRKRMTLKKAVGEYHTDSGVIRVKAMHDMEVIAHEAGHHLEGRNFPNVQALLKRSAASLKPLAYPGAPAGQQREEGFAEFFRWYLRNPDHAKAVAGPFYDQFEKALGADNPKLLADLRDIQQAWADFLKAPSSGVVASMIVNRKAPSVVARYKQAYAEDPQGAVAMATDEAFASTIDRFHPLNVALRELRGIAARNGRTIGDLKTANDPYRLARMASGAYASGHMDITAGVRPHGKLDPEGPSLQEALVSALGKRWTDDDFTNFGAYLMSRRMIGEWRRFEAGDLNRPPDSLSRETHEQAIADYERAKPAWRDAAAMVYEWQNKLWKKRHDAGLIGDDTYLSGLNDHPDYVPAQRDLSDESALPGRSRGGGSGKFAGGVQQFRGSDRPYLNPVQSMMREAFELNQIIARNEVLLSLQEVASVAGPGSAAIIEKIPAKELTPVQVDALEAARTIAEASGLNGRDIDAMIATLEAGLSDDPRVTLFQSRAIDERGEPILYAWRNGERIALRLPDGEFGRQMYDSLAGMTPPQKSIFLDSLAAFAGVQRAGIVTAPAFMLRNFFRDQFSAWMLTDVGVKPLASAARGVVEQLTGASNAKRYNSLGGLMGGANVSALSPVRTLKPTALQPMRANFGGALRAATRAIELAETGTRLGIYRNAFRKGKRDGLNDYEAAMEALFEARDYFDTDLHGSRMLAAKRILPFFNANLQGLRKAMTVGTADGNLRRLLAPLGKSAPQTPREKADFVKAYKLWAKVSALGVMGASLTALYLDDPEYGEFDSQERATHWMVKGPGGWLKLPKPFELAALSNIFERGVERFYGEDPNAWKSMRKGLAEILLPPVQSPAITVPVEIVSNKDYAGRPIVPDHLRGKVDPVLQSNSYTSELGKLIGRTFNISPAVADHALNGFLGTWGREAEKASNFFRPTERPAPAREDAFAISGFRTTPERGTASASEFWKLMAASGGKLTQAEGSYRNLIKADKPDEALAYAAKLDDVSRSYVLSQVFSEDGSGKYHPLERARLANGVLSEMRRDIADGKPIRGANGNPISLTPTERRDADKALASLQMAELLNGLKAAGVEGWGQRDFIVRRDYLQALHEASPPLSAVLNMRMKVAKVPTPAEVSKTWPKIEAILGGLSDAQLERLMQAERAASPTTRLNEALKRRAGVAG